MEEEERDEMTESTAIPKPDATPEAGQRSPLDLREATPAEPESNGWGSAKADTNAKSVVADGVDLFYGDFKAVEGISLTIRPNRVTALIGSSGCGKTTFLRSINRMHELTAGARVSGSITVDDLDIYDPRVDPVQVRRMIGMVFQQPNPFPTMSIYENVAAGLTLNSSKISKSEKDDVVERSLRGAHLWEEVKDRLDKPGSGLSGGQQQRLCIARAISVAVSYTHLTLPTNREV